MVWLYWNGIYIYSNSEPRNSSKNNFFSLNFGKRTIKNIVSLFLYYFFPSHFVCVFAHMFTIYTYLFAQFPHSIIVYVLLLYILDTWWKRGWLNNEFFLNLFIVYYYHIDLCGLLFKYFTENNASFCWKYIYRSKGLRSTNRRI